MIRAWSKSARAGWEKSATGRRLLNTSRIPLLPQTDKRVADPPTRPCFGCLSAIFAAPAERIIAAGSAGAIVGYQERRGLLFLHWRVPASDLRTHANLRLLV